MTADSLAVALLVGAAIVLLAVFGMRLASRIRVPGLLIFLVLGLALSSFEPFDFEDPQLAVVLGYSALVIILAEGGLTTRVSSLRPVLWPSVALATVGVAISICVVGAVVHFVVGIDWRTALLLGAVLAATDAAAVYSILRRLPLPSRLRTLLEAEAGFNDAPVVVMVSVLSTAAVTDASAWELPALVLLELIGGAAVGLLIGWSSRWAMPRLALPAAGLYPIAALAFLVAAFGLADLLHVSGFLAVYVAGILLGSTPQLPHRRTVLGFVEALALVSEIGLFVMLGMLAELWRLPEAIFAAVVACLALLLLARPLASVASLSAFRLPRKWIAFVGVAGLRGAVPIIFAAIPLGAGATDAPLIFDATLIIVLVLTILQAPTLPWIARRLNVAVEGKSDEYDVDVAPLDQMHAVALSMDVPVNSRLVGVYVTELGLPAGAVVAMIVRNNEAVAPNDLTRLKEGDQLMIIAGDKVRRETEKRMRALARSGRLASWWGDEGGA